MISEQPPERLLSESPVGLIVATLGGQILAHNQRLISWLVVTDTQQTNEQNLERSLVGRDIAEWLTPASKLLYETRVIPQLLERGSIRETIIQVRTADGAVLSVLINIDVVETAEGEKLLQIAMISAVQRISFEQELLNEKRRSEVVRNQLVVLQQASEQMAIASGIEDLCETLITATQTTMQAPWVFVRIDMGHKQGIFGKRWERGSRPSVDLPIEFMNTQLICRSSEEMQAWSQESALKLRSAGVEAFICVPISSADLADTVSGEVWAWFQRPRSLERETIETISALTSQADLVLDRLALQESVQHQATHDGLTGLANRVMLTEQLGQIIATSTREQIPCAVLFLDLDGFKSINDSRGHSAGDEVLRIVADRLRETCRAGEVVSRLGGDEFVVCATGLDADGAVSMASRIWSAIREPLAGEAEGMPLSSSIGMVVWQPEPGVEAPMPAELLELADEVMYDVKKTGKDAVSLQMWGQPRLPVPRQGS